MKTLLFIRTELVSYLTVILLSFMVAVELGGFYKLPTSANGQEAFCMHPSHGEGGWSGPCRATGKEAHEDAVQHVTDNPAHKDDTTTKPCDLP